MFSIHYCVRQKTLLNHREKTVPFVLYGIHRQNFFITRLLLDQSKEAVRLFSKVSLDQLDFKQFLQVTQMNPISNESIIVEKHYTFSDLFQEMPPFCGRKIRILTYSLVTKRFRCIKGWSSRTELHCLQKVQAWNMQVS